MATKATLGVANDPIQSVLAEDLKQAMRKGTVARDRAKAALSFLGQPVGRAVIQRLKRLRDEWLSHSNPALLVSELERLALDYGKAGPETSARQVTRNDLRLVCFVYVTG